MRTYTAHVVRFHAYRMQRRAFVAGLIGSLAFIGFALVGRESLAMACSMVACFGYGASAGSWVTALRFKE